MTRKPKLELTREQGWGWNETMVISAFRYCVGRQTYVVQACADWLIDIWPMLGANTKAVIQRDLEMEFESDDNARMREACAQVAEGFDACDPKHIAAAIRARGEKK